MIIRKLNGYPTVIGNSYTQWISNCSTTAKKRVSSSINNNVAGVCEHSRQNYNLKNEGNTSQVNGVIHVQTAQKN
ncbi:protein of unknown function [Xenorhabdus nematophila AN6/1]|nr:hypothetical protein XNA1_940002 [Xenorhabdus nematophila str. Anatoliense]CEF29443.1 hypothetical protein XNW1_1770002 [Xenorhabdus nematophila str. Websteri]CEF34032.1 hypothetical protein XNW1_760002 [Xenorhabdus nematophila str. Websteri]CEK23095.1 protein of unknown function [Xenorhabdus nematophila AN6/1]